MLNTCNDVFQQKQCDRQLTVVEHWFWSGSVLRILPMMEEALGMGQFPKYSKKWKPRGM